MKTLLIATLSLTSAPAFAMLSPYWDSVKQMEAVLESNKVAESFHGAINQITAKGNGVFEIHTDFCVGQVTLESHLPGMPGATTYTVKSINNLNCE